MKTDKLFGSRRKRYPYLTSILPIEEVPNPTSLKLILRSKHKMLCVTELNKGDTVKAGDVLASDSENLAMVSPVKAKFVDDGSCPDIRGARNVFCLTLQPEADTSPVAFSALDFKNETVEKLWERVEQAGIMTDSLFPRPLAEVIDPKKGRNSETLVISAADREPLVSSALQLFRERMKDAVEATLLLGRLADAKRLVLAVPEAVAAEASEVCGGNGIEVFKVHKNYPSGLKPVLAHSLGSGEHTNVVAIETALGTLDAVQEGKVQDTKIVTIIDGDGKPIKNVRVPIGMCVKELLEHVGLSPKEGDKLVIGGPMGGFPQFDLDVSIDAGVNAVMLVKAENIVNWDNDPCIYCGSCVQVCPANLQPHLLGGYAERNDMKATEDFSIKYCIECGYCATVCPAHRPLLQWIRLAKHELRMKKAMELEKMQNENENETDGTGGDNA